MDEAVHPNARALALAIKRRREEELDMSMDLVAKRGGPKKPTQVRYEAGDIPLRPQPATLNKINRALDWPKGYAQALLEGQPIEDLPQPSPIARDMSADELSVGELQERLSRFVSELWGTKRTPGMPAPAARRLDSLLLEAMEMLEDIGGSPIGPPGLPPGLQDDPSESRTPGLSGLGVRSR
jgi:hypothetical protein